MEIKINEEAGLTNAIIGMKFSFEKEGRISDIATDFHDPDWYDQHEKGMKVAKKLCQKDGGHNKFLEQIQVWMTIRASMDWWKQMDTYRVGTSKLSKSTMHTIMRKPISAEDFDWAVDQRILDVVEEYRLRQDFIGVSKNLPQGFLQTRMVNTNYKVLRNIILQRTGHKLPEWSFFIRQMFNKLANPELLGINKGEN